MNYESPLTNACHELKQASQRGYQINQSLAAYIVCRSLTLTLPNAQVVYDGRQLGDSPGSPNIFVWDSETTSSLTFIGNIRCEARDDADDRVQIRTLEEYADATEVSVLDRDPVSFEYRTKILKISPNPELALLFVHNETVKLHHWSVSLKRNDA